ncbi:MAG: acyltransferase family protein [Beijerinckiaceae bacterium]
MNRATSLYLDVVRPVAALVVLLSHVGDNLSFLAPAGVQAVDVFFVLSGFVIAHVSGSRERDFRVYFISRAARIYSVAIPALILTAILDSIGLRENAAAYAGHPFQPLAPGVLTRCVFFINEQWTTHRFPGSNSPYWSLGFEVWYYVAFGVWIFVPRPWRWLAIAGVLVFIGPKVALLFPLWLMGVGVYRICNDPLSIRPSAGWVLFAAPLLILVMYQFLPHAPMQPFINIIPDFSRFLSLGQDYLVGILFSAHLIGFTVVSAKLSHCLENHAQTIRWIAGATFSVYLAHLPIMTFLVALSPWPNSSPWMVALRIAITILACLAFAEVSERRKDAWRRLITRGILTLEKPLLYVVKTFRTVSLAI